MKVHAILKKQGVVSAERLKYSYSGEHSAYNLSINRQTRTGVTEETFR